MVHMQICRKSLAVDKEECEVQGKDIDSIRDMHRPLVKVEEVGNVGDTSN